MAAQRTCEECGAELPANAPQGLCPRCLVAMGLSLAGSEPAHASAQSEIRNPKSEIGSKVRYFGDYELLEEIARGGMGVVYRARQTKLNRIVAVKMLLFGKFSSDEFVKRFQTEAQAVASLQHPNIVAIHEVGEHEGQHYFSMDYIEGKNLADLVRDKPLPARQAAAYLKIIAEAIHYAHQHSVLHRDLKPSNVLIDEFDQPRITDFGLAKQLKGDSELTVTGQMLGSPNYMPPEQADRKRGEVTAASDVYSLGAIFYHLLTTRPPFVAETLEDTLRQLLNDEPVALRRLNPSVPRDLETLCLKCLEKEPTKRYQTAHQFADELDRFLNDESIHARPVSHVEMLWRWCRRKPALVAAICVAGIAAALMLLFASQSRHSEQQRWIEKRQGAIDKTLLAAWSGDMTGAEGFIREAETAGASHGDVRMLRGLVAIRRGEYGEAVQHLEQAVKLTPTSVAAQTLLIKAYSMVGRWEKAEPIFSTLASLSPKTTEDYMLKGAAITLLDPAQALESLNEAVRRRPSGITRLFRGQARVLHAQNTGSTADLEAALADVDAANAALPGNPLALALNVMAQLVAAGLFEETREYEKRDNALREANSAAMPLPQYPHSSDAFLTRAYYLKQTTNDVTLVDELRRANDANDNIFGHYYVALSLYRLGRLPEALDETSRGTMSNSAFGGFIRGYIVAELPDGPNIAFQEFNKAWQRNPSPLDAMIFETTLRLLGRKAEAVQASLQVRERADLLPSARNGWCRRLLDYHCDLLNAHDLLKQAGPSRWNQSEAHFRIGLTRLAEGDRSAAREHFRQTVALGIFESFDYDWSKAFLARLEKDPNWPPWIPAKAEL